MVANRANRATQRAAPGRPRRRRRHPHRLREGDAAGVRALRRRIPRGVLRQAQITPRQLADPGTRITARQLETVSSLAMQQLDDEALGWFSRRLPWGSLGMLCRASLGSPTLGLALRRWFRHHRLLTEDLLIELEVRGAHRGGDAHRAPPARRHARVLPPLLPALRARLRLLGHRLAPHAARGRASPSARPPHGDVYPLLFPGPVHFGAPARPTSPSTPSTWPCRSGATTPPLRRHAAAGPAAHRAAVPARPAAGPAGAPAAGRGPGGRARRRRGGPAGLGLDPHAAPPPASRRGPRSRGSRTRCGGSGPWRSCPRAQEPVKQVARAVGFRSEKSFARAFRGWTGRSPGECRRMGVAEEPAR